MKRKLRPLVEKEIKDLLRDPRIYIGLIVSIIMLPLIGFAMSIALRSATEVAVKDLKIALVDYDETNASRGFISLLAYTGLNVSNVSVGNLDLALEEARKIGSKSLLIIPEGFEEHLLGFGKINIEVYAIIESIGISSAGAQGVIDQILTTASKILSDSLISRIAPGVDPDVIREPLNVTGYTVIKDRIVKAPPQALLGQIMLGYGFMVPMVLLILAITVTQTAATATAIENEEKTLETLLTFPVTRYDILMAKMLGSSIVAVLGGIFFAAGFFIYYQGLFGPIGLGISAGNIAEALPTPTFENYAILALSLILAILFLTSLGVVIGALSSDVRMSGSLLGIVIVPVLIPSFLIMYGDLRALPLGLQLLVYALPTSYPMIMSKEMIMSTIPVETFYGIPYSAALTLIVLYATSKVLAPEKLLTLQHKLKIRRMKRKPERDLE